MCIRDRDTTAVDVSYSTRGLAAPADVMPAIRLIATRYQDCLLYTSDAADDLLCVDLGGRRIIKKKNNKLTYTTTNPHPHP